MGKNINKKIKTTIKGTLLLTGLLMIVPVLTQAKSADKPPIEAQYEQRKYISIVKQDVGSTCKYESAGYKGYLHRSTRPAYTKNGVKFYTYSGIVYRFTGGGPSPGQGWGF